MGYFPNEWKVAEIIMSQKPGKPPEEVTHFIDQTAYCELYPKHSIWKIIAWKAETDIGHWEANCRLSVWLQKWAQDYRISP